jgi:phosphoserine aminotransferase
MEFAFVFSRQDDDLMANLSGNVPIGTIDQQSMYIMNAVLNDYQEKGSEVLLRESNYKAAVLYQLLETSKNLEPLANKAERSKTTITAICESGFLLYIQKLGYDVESHPVEGKQVLTIANYPTHSKETIEMFADRIAVL